MVKKKVVKRHSSKALPKDNKKNVIKRVVQKHKPIRRHAIIHSLAKAKAKHNRTKAENLELAANIAVKDSKTAEPAPVEQKISVQAVQEPGLEVQMTAPIKDEEIVQPDPIFADDMKANIPTVNDGEQSSKGMKITVLIVTTVILSFWIILISMSIITNVDRVVERNTTVTVIEPIDINLEKYIKINNMTYTEDVSLIGYLREEMVADGAINRIGHYILDNYDNRIKLLLDNQETRTYDLIFLMGATSEKTYNVTGTFKYIQYEKVIDVTGITQQAVPTHVVETEKVENVTIMGKGFRIDVPTGWKRLTGKV